MIEYENKILEYDSMIENENKNIKEMTELLENQGKCKKILIEAKSRSEKLI